jgi:hypothetical protein
MKWDRIMKVYSMYVWMKKGMALLPDTSEINICIYGYSPNHT